MKAVEKPYASQIGISEARKTLDISSNATVYKYIHPNIGGEKGADKSKTDR